MKPQSGRMQPTLFNPLGFNPFSLWTDIALKTGEIMLASAHAAERSAKTTANASAKPRSNGNGKAKRSAKRRSRK
jgi:hypothetical protein